MFVPSFSWSDVIQHEKVGNLRYAPLLDAAGVLLKGAGMLWQSAWPDGPGQAPRYLGGRSVAAKIIGFGHEVAHHAAETRTGALGWLEPAVLAHHRQFIEVDEEACGPLLADFCSERYHWPKEKEPPRSPEAGRLLTGAGLALFVDALQSAAQVEDGLGRTRNVSEWSERLDKFLALPGIAACLPPDEAALAALRRWGLLRLAEDLAYTGSAIVSHLRDEHPEGKVRADDADRRHVVACAAYESFVTLASPHDHVRQSLLAVADTASGYPHDGREHWSTEAQVKRALHLLDGLAAAIDTALGEPLSILAPSALSGKAKKPKPALGGRKAAK
jgi:hypothetical protein